MWLCQSNKDLFCVSDQNPHFRPSTVQLPPETEMVHYSACQDAIWGLDSLGQIFIRTLSSSCPTGMHWTKLDLSQLGMTFLLSRLSLSILYFPEVSFSLLVQNITFTGLNSTYWQMSVKHQEQLWLSKSVLFSLFLATRSFLFARYFVRVQCMLQMVSLRWLGLTRFCARAPAAFTRLALVPQGSHNHLV